MNLIGLMPVKNEDWVLGLSLRAALMVCDSVVVLLHDCTDGSLEIAQDIRRESLDDSRCRVHILQRAGATWTERADRWSMLQLAREKGATHIATIDADEVLTGNLYIRELISLNLKPASVLCLPWLALPRTLDRYLTSGTWGHRQAASVAFKDRREWYWDPQPQNGYDLHHRAPMSFGDPARAIVPIEPAEGGIMHLQFLSERRLRAKQALYQMNEVLRWPFPRPVGMTPNIKGPEDLAALYGKAVYESDPLEFESAAVPDSWWAPYGDLMKYLHIDAEPWQETEVKRLISEHGRGKFKGLDLFGVA